MPDAPLKPFSKEALDKDRADRKKKADRDARPYRNSGLTWGQYKALPYNEQRGLDIRLNMAANVERVKMECATGQPIYVTRAKQPETPPAEPERPALVLTAPPGCLPRVVPRLRPKRGKYYKPHHRGQLWLPLVWA